MDTSVMIGGIFIAVAVLLGSFILYSFYGGSRSYVCNAKVGDVFNFEYEQPLHGEPKRFLAKVIEPVYTLSDDRISYLNRSSNYRKNDPIFKRTKNLIVCETPDGKIRQFYAERIKNCRKPFLAGALFKTAAAML
jgi:hypothetical protein